MTMETATTDDSYIRVIPSPSIIRRRRRMQELTKPLTAGGSRATILALTTSSLGAGVFTMPYGFSQSGKTIYDLSSSIALIERIL